MSSAYQFVSTWAEKNPAEAAQWVNTLPEGSARDRAVSGLISSQGEYEPAQAFAWAATIGDTSERQDAMRTSARQLYAADPAVAESTIVAADLPEEDKARLLAYARDEPDSDDQFIDDFVLNDSTDEAVPPEEAPAHSDDYTVQAGDSFSAIAKKLGVKVGDLMQANAGADPRKLQIGQKLSVPGSPITDADLVPTEGN